MAVVALVFGSDGGCGLEAGVCMVVAIDWCKNLIVGEIKNETTPTIFCFSKVGYHQRY